MKYHFTTVELNDLLNYLVHLAGSKGVTFKGLKGSMEESDLNLVCNSLVVCLRELTSNPGLRLPPLELDLFSRSDIGNAYRSICIVERITLLYTSLGCQTLPTLSQSIVSLIQWCYLYNKGEGEKLAKYQSVIAFNLCEKVELPEDVSLPFGWKKGIMAGGAFGRFHRGLMSRLPLMERTESLRLTQCFLYFKKGCPMVSETFVEAALKKHKKALTDTKPIALEKVLIDSVSVNPIDFEKIRQRTRLICEDVFEDYEAQETWYDPSHSSAYGTSRAKGGQLNDLDFTTFGGWTFNPVSRKSEPCPGNDNWEYFDTGREFIKVPIQVAPKLRVTKDIFAEPVALTEPLKVRVITKETTWSTYALGGAQKKLWKCLKNHPWFRLVGRPTLPEDIPIFTEFGQNWISVDYSAATDNLNAQFSELIMDEISALIGLPNGLCKESLTGHKIAYDGEIYNQTNGQLMGSKLSFIILCIANAVVISLSLNPGEYDDCADFLVNGDDGLFVGSLAVYARWQQIAQTLGLSPSIGKVYVSRNFCVINSQAFCLNDYGLPVKVDYPNASGLQRYDARTYSKEKGPMDLAASYTLWMDGFKSAFNQIEAEKLWFHTFQYILCDPKIKGIEWFIPQCLGGLGIPLPVDVPYFSKAVSREMSPESYSRMRLCLSSGIPLKPIESEQIFNKVENPFLTDVCRRDVYFTFEEPAHTIPMRMYEEDQGLSDIPENTQERIARMLKLKVTHTKFQFECFARKDWKSELECQHGAGASMVALSCLNPHLRIVDVGRVKETEPDFSISKSPKWDLRGYKACKKIPYESWCGTQVRCYKDNVNVWEPTLISGLHGYHDFLSQLEQTQNQFRCASDDEVMFISAAEIGLD